MKFEQNHWALILGGSSGFGLATAKKLSQAGMNLCIVHRDRKGSMARIQPEFDALRENGVKVLTHNTNALLQEDMQAVLESLEAELKSEGKIKVLLHSIAYGNLKLLAPQTSKEQNQAPTPVEILAEGLGIDKANLQTKVDELFEAGNFELANLATPAEYDNQNFLQEEDFRLTVHSMGTSLAMWVQGVFNKSLFANPASVISLTSEGNEVAWKGYAAVSAAKTALEAVSRAIASEYAAYGIRSNVVQAGVTDTPALRLIPGNLHLKASALTRNPFNRLTKPEDVANFIYLLCQKEAEWVNGNIIRVDGGEHISG